MAERTRPIRIEFCVTEQERRLIQIKMAQLGKAGKHLEDLIAMLEEPLESREFRILFSDETASARLLDKLCELSKEDFITRLMQNSLLSYEQAEAVLYFQMNGCLAINRMMIKQHCSDWTKIQQTIDQFIKAGIENFLIHDQREELL